MTSICSPGGGGGGSGGTLTMELELEAAQMMQQESGIEFLGLWRDTWDRAMPIKMNVNPGNKNQVSG